MTASVPVELIDDKKQLDNALGNDSSNGYIKKALNDILTSATPDEIKIIDNEGINGELTKQINFAIKEFRKLKAEGKPAKKPKFTIDGKTWIFDKIEEGRLIVTNKNTFIICVHKYDILSFDNHFITDDKEQEEKSQETKLCTETNERAELTSATEFELGNTYEISYKFFLPKDFKKLENRLVIGQIKQKAGDGVTPNPLVCWRIKNENLLITFNNSGDPTGNGENKVVFQRNINNYLGRWIDVKFEIKFDEKKGFINIYLDKETVFSLQNDKISSSSDLYKVGVEYLNEFFFKFGLYRDTIKKRIKELNAEINKIQSEGNGIGGEKDLATELIKEVRRLQKAQEDEDNGNAMTIYFKDFDVKTA